MNHTTSVWGILAVLLACPSVTHANYFEFELDATDLGDLVRENAIYDSYTNDAFCPREFSSFMGIFFLDDIDFPSAPGPFVRPAPGSYGWEQYGDIGITNYHPTQLVVPVILRFKHADDFYDPATDINDFDASMNADLVFALSANETEICFTYTGVESTVPNIEDYTNEIAVAIGGVGCLPVDITAFDMLLSGLVPAHAGITSDAQGDRLAFRVEYGADDVPDLSPQNLASWDEFYNFWTSAATLTYDWNMLLDQDLLRQSLENQIATSMGSSDDVDLDSISSVWTPDGEYGGYVNMNLEFTVHELGNPFYDICTPLSVDAQIVMDLDMEGDALVVDGEIYPDLTMNWLCEFLNFGFASIPKLIVITVYPIPFTVANCTSWDDGRKFKCEYPIELPVLDFTPEHYGSPVSSLDADEMRGEADGLVLGGPSNTYLVTSFPPRSGVFEQSETTV